MTQVCLQFIRKETGIAAEDFVVLAFGKLGGGAELQLGPRLRLPVRRRRRDGTGDRAATDPGHDRVDGPGVHYRVDMRLRPWGSPAHSSARWRRTSTTSRRTAQLWEKQGSSRRGPSPGNLTMGYKALNKIEGHHLRGGAGRGPRERPGHEGRDRDLPGTERPVVGAGQGGKGSIRDVEFLTQYLQLAYGGLERRIRSKGTLDGLIRLAEFDFIQADEYRQLSGGYVFLRTVEHALQLLHNQAEHALPDNPARAGLPGGPARLAGGRGSSSTSKGTAAPSAGSLRSTSSTEGGDGLARPQRPGSREPAPGDAAASYQDVYSPEQTRRHLEMLQELRDARIVRAAATPRTEGCGR